MPEEFGQDANQARDSLACNDGGRFDRGMSGSLAGEGFVPAVLLSGTSWGTTAVTGCIGVLNSFPGPCIKGRTVNPSGGLFIAVIGKWDTRQMELKAFSLDLETTSVDAFVLFCVGRLYQPCTDRHLCTASRQ